MHYFITNVKLTSFFISPVKLDSPLIVINYFYFDLVVSLRVLNEINARKKLINGIKYIGLLKNQHTMNYE